MAQATLGFEAYQVGGKVFSTEQLADRLEPDPKTMARAADPATSKLAALSVSKRSPSQQVILLLAYRDAELIDEEAGDATNLSKKPKCCYWKRLSELRQAGYIEDTGRLKLSSVGEKQRICRVTAKGREFIQQWEAANR